MFLNGTGTAHSHWYYSSSWKHTTCRMQMIQSMWCYMLWCTLYNLCNLSVYIPWPIHLMIHNFIGCVSGRRSRWKRTKRLQTRENDCTVILLQLRMSTNLRYQALAKDSDGQEIVFPKSPGVPVRTQWDEENQKSIEKPWSARVHSFFSSVMLHLLRRLGLSASKSSLWQEVSEVWTSGFPKAPHGFRICRALCRRFHHLLLNLRVPWN